MKINKIDLADFLKIAQSKDFLVSGFKLPQVVNKKNGKIAFHGYFQKARFFFKGTVYNSS